MPLALLPLLALLTHGRPVGIRPDPHRCQWYPGSRHHRRRCCCSSSFHLVLQGPPPPWALLILPPLPQQGRPRIRCLCRRPLAAASPFACSRKYRRRTGLQYRYALSRCVRRREPSQPRVPTALASTQALLHVVSRFVYTLTQSSPFSYVRFKHVPASLRATIPSSPRPVLQQQLACAPCGRVIPRLDPSAGGNV